MFKIILLITVQLIALNQAFNLTEYTNTIKLLMSDIKYEKDLKQHINNILAIDPDYYNYKPIAKFDCDVSGSEPARSVHKLRPSDVKVVAALGDSLTASLGAKATTVFGLLYEYREVSWSIGGEATLDTIVTLPNIIKKFSPQLYGFSTDWSLALTTKTGVGFNAAVSGQEANHMADQARTLITRLKENKNIDFENDWKVITLFIGGNDLCDFCKDKALHSPQQYADDISAALDLFHNELPKTLVNLVSVLNVAQVEQLNIGLTCSTLHSSVCPCAAYPKNDDERKQLKEYFEGYSTLTEQMAASGKYDTREDFTVVYQPFFRDFVAPRTADGKIDISYFAPDCFHFSLKSHGNCQFRHILNVKFNFKNFFFLNKAMAAVGLWNSMFQPVGQKATTFTVGETIQCPPVDHPYFYTNKN